MHQHKDHYSLKSVAVPVLAAAAAAAAAAVTGVPNVVVDNLLNFVAVLARVVVAWATCVVVVVVVAAAVAVDNPVKEHYCLMRSATAWCLAAHHKNHYSLKSVAVPAFAAVAEVWHGVVAAAVADNPLNFVAVLSGVAVAWATTVEFVVVAAAAAAVDNPVNKVAGHLQTHRVDAGAVVVHTAHVVAAAAAAAAAAAVEI